MSAFDDRRSANKTREARFIAVAKYTTKMRHACMSAFDDRKSADKTREARFIAVAKYTTKNAACLHVSI